MTKIVVKVSNDGKQWKTVESVEFGNLVNDPTKRFHYFKETIPARYVRIEPTVMAQEGKLTLDNIDLL